MIEHRAIRKSDGALITERDGVKFSDMRYHEWAKARDEVLTNDPKAVVQTMRLA